MHITNVISPHHALFPTYPYLFSYKSSFFIDRLFPRTFLSRDPSINKEAVRCFPSDGFPENDYWLSASLAPGRLICNRETRASHTSPACRWSAWALRPSLHSRQSAPVRACPPRRPCLHRHRSWHSALSPLQGSRCAR